MPLLDRAGPSRTLRRLSRPRLTLPDVHGLPESGRRVQRGPLYVKAVRIYNVAFLLAGFPPCGAGPPSHNPCINRTPPRPAFVNACSLWPWGEGRGGCAGELGNGTPQRWKFRITNLNALFPTGKNKAVMELVCV